MHRAQLMLAIDSVVREQVVVCRKVASRIFRHAIKVQRLSLASLSPAICQRALGGKKLR
jgi:hypothetical protein